MPEDGDAAPHERPADPNAPTRHTLPSGKVVEIRSHRTLLAADVEEALGAQVYDSWMRNVMAMRTVLVARTAAEVEPGTGGCPALDGTVEAVRAQRADDYRALFPLVTPAMDLVLRNSVIPDVDEWEDPKAPTTPS